MSKIIPSFTPGRNGLLGVANNAKKEGVGERPCEARPTLISKKYFFVDLVVIMRILPIVFKTSWLWPY